MDDWLFVLLLKPFMVFAFFMIVFGIEWAIISLLPDGRLKRILLKKIS